MYISLKRGLQSEYKDVNIYHILNKEIQPNQENVLLLCDGLDEYKDPANIVTLKDTLLNIESELNSNLSIAKLKIIFTTRLEASFPEQLRIKTYVRLLPFKESQVNTFFTKYGMSQHSFKKSSNYGLGDEDKKKPLFCWMIASNSNSERFLQQSVTPSIKLSQHLTMALLYQDFIHSLIRARHIHTSPEFSGYYIDEKNLLRKIAALKQSCESSEEILTVSKVIKRLKDYYGLDFKWTEEGKIYSILLYRLIFIYIE